MSDDAMTAWKCLLSAYCYAQVAMWKWGSGVSDDSKASDVCNGVAGDDLLRGVHDRGLARGANHMKEQDEHRGQIIDFEAAADRVRMRRWAVANGFDRVRG